MICTKLLLMLDKSVIVVPCILAISLAISSSALLYNTLIRLFLGTMCAVYLNAYIRIFECFEWKQGQKYLR